VIFALRMLTKPTFAVYLLAPLLWAVAVPAGGGRRARIGGLVLALGVAAAIALPWYGPRLIALPMQFADRSFRFAAAEGHAGALSAAGLAFYPRARACVRRARRDPARRRSGRALAATPGGGSSGLGDRAVRAGDPEQESPLRPARSCPRRRSSPRRARALLTAWRRAAVACVAVGALPGVAAFACRRRFSDLFGLRWVFSHRQAGTGSTRLLS
jgi:hypothetical protein